MERGKDGRFRGLLRALIVVCASTGSVLAQSPEFRAMWVSRFEWPNADQATCKATIDDVMQTLAANNFNAVFMQIRGQADVLYPSPYEVWSPLIGGTDPGWDPLAYMINAAHANGIEFHAYINTHTCWQSGTHAAPANASHLFFAHCDASDPARRDWLIHDSAGNPVQWHENDYVWIAPGVPAYQAYMRQQVLYVVENYDVDGVHFDRIRTPNSSYSYDPISEARRASTQSNPDNLDFSHWTRDQITRMVRDIYAAVMAVKPEVKVSAAVFPNPNTAPASVHQEATVWAQTGGLDIIVPMMYSTGGEGSTWDTRLQAWLAGCAGRHVVAGQITSEGVTWLLDQIDLTRTRGAQGNSVFSWSSFTFWDDYKSDVYQVPTALPAMSWKTSPSTGIIYGYVTDATTGLPVTDAQVVRTGSSYVGLSSGDGFYSFLLVPPGTYALTASHPAYGSNGTAIATVAAGEVVRYDIVVNAPLPPVIAEVTPDPDSVVVGTEYSRQLSLTQGTADSWTLIEGPAGATVDSNGYLHDWTPTIAQAGQLVAFTVRATNSLGSDDESWQVQVDASAPCSPFELMDFEPYSTGANVLFRTPRYSGTTVNDLATSPNVAAVTDAVAAFSGEKCYRVEWQYIDTDPQRWMRLTTHDAPGRPNPTVLLHHLIRVRMRVDSGRFRLAAGIRETDTIAEVGDDGGASGTIEWVGAETDIDGAPQGVLVEPMPGVWQTFTFDLQRDPIHGFTGDGILATANDKGVFEHLAFSVVDAVGPFTVYLDDIEFLCVGPADYDQDGDVDADDAMLFEDCASGTGIPAPTECADRDFDADGDVDQADFGVFQRCVSGEDIAADPTCVD